jgi:hypothetical protein
MNVQTYIYLGIGFMAFVPCLAFALNRRPKKAAVTVTLAQPFFPEAASDDVTAPDDDDVTVPYIRLPFFDETNTENDQEDTRPILRVSNWP